jgi:ABC-2 type transport system permease protein
MMSLQRQRVPDTAAFASGARVWAVMRLEWLTQRREPLIALYMLVLLALGATFAASGPVDLVGARGTVPRDAPWSIALACTALTAFGQVITTMVAATVVLRDSHDRVHEFIGTTQLSRQEYLLGKLLAALALLCVIYSAIPIGLCLGATFASGDPVTTLRASLIPFMLIVLPTMIAVGALQFSAGVLSGRLWVIVAQGLVLIWLWTWAVGTVRSSELAIPGALFDPFGAAPMLHATQRWSDAQRATLPIPLSPLLLANRLLWLIVAGTVAAIAVVRGPSARGAQWRRVNRDVRGTTSPVSASSASPLQQAGASRASDWRAAVSVARYVARWTVRDTGWRVLTVLAMVNVAVHAANDLPAAHGAGGITSGALSVLQLHSRLFLILLATIYAGELVWRERDDRSAHFFDTLPIPDAALIGGNVAGVVAAQAVVVVALTLAVAIGAAVGVRSLLDVPEFVIGAVHRVLLPSIGWLLAALAVHVICQQKLVGHLLCIAGWALASVLGNAALPAPQRVPSSFTDMRLLLSLLSLVTILGCFWHRGPGSRVSAWRAKSRLRTDP